MRSNEWRILDPVTGVWVFEYGFPGGDAFTFAVQFEPGKWLAISPGCGMPESAFTALAAEGEVVALIAPNGAHYLGIPEWLQRWPKARCFAPEGTIARLSKKSKIETPFEPVEALLPILPEHIVLSLPDGLKYGEVLLKVRTGEGWIWHITDIFLNVQQMPRNLVVRFFLWAFKSAPGFRANRMFQVFFARDVKALKAWFLATIETHPPVMIVPGHGAILEGEDVLEVFQAEIIAGM